MADEESKCTHQTRKQILIYKYHAIIPALLMKQAEGVIISRSIQSSLPSKENLC